MVKKDSGKDKLPSKTMTKFAMFLLLLCKELAFSLKGLQTNPRHIINSWYFSENNGSLISLFFIVFFFAIESFGPIVDFYVTEHSQTPHPQNPVRLYKEVLVQKDSNITLTCTAKEPETSLPLWLFGTKLQPSMIKWYVNSSFFDVSNCDETAAKRKTCTLSLTNIRPQDCGKYVCKAANQVRCTYDELNITVASGRKLYHLKKLLFQWANLCS